MPPGSRVAPGSCRATVRSWVSSRVASAYGCGLALAADPHAPVAGCRRRSRPSAGQDQPLRADREVRRAGRAAAPSTSVSAPQTSRVAAATASSAAPSANRRRSAATVTGTARYGSTADAPSPPVDAEVRRRRRPGWRPAPRTTTSAKPAERAEQPVLRGERRPAARRRPAGRSTRAGPASRVASRVRTATSASMTTARGGGERVASGGGLGVGGGHVTDRSQRSVDVGDLVGVRPCARRCRLTFSDGVSSPVASVKSCGRIRNTLIASALETAWLASSTARLDLGPQRLVVAQLGDAVVSGPAVRGQPLRQRLLVDGDQRGDERLPVADHHALADQRVRPDPVLQHRRGDVLAAGGDDDLLLAPGDLQVAVVVELAQVAGVEPAVGVEHLGGGRLVVPVPLEDQVAGDQDLAVVGDPDA